MTDDADALVDHIPFSLVVQVLGFRAARCGIRGPCGQQAPVAVSTCPPHDPKRGTVGLLGFEPAYLAEFDRSLAELLAAPVTGGR